MKKIKLHIELTRAEEGGYIIYCPELDITTEGESVEDAIAMIKDAAAGYIDVVGLDNIPSFSGKTLKEELEMVVNG